MKNRAVRPCLMSILQMAPNTLTCIKITALRYRLRISSNSDHTGVTGFDGQELPEDYTKGFLSPKYDIENASTTGVIEDTSR